MKKRLIFTASAVYIFLAILLVYFITKSNYEFIGYTVIVGLLFNAVLYANKHYNFPLLGIWLVAIWGVLHLFGGSIYIGGTRLYDLILINIMGPPFFILKYDQFVHAFCYFAFAIIVYYMLKKHMKPKQTVALITFTILAAAGIGMLNEVIEFGMVIYAGAAEAVGGYYNTALDMVFNFIGAIIGAFYSGTILDRS
ncbi:DUF2238 domain-containing protein [archaeon]|jgi:uncharacterized membrane protein YjdF|nr:DUF2238 domain-containing protein [archaeon]MBT3578238.1 DUF2238 domain-containing protein [archaeon]MBT6819841.1 DUF2238 domain-containing protein [archaeon]MBT6956584.1 DUF2238 domain-containing protein [archaeon]MBT7025623.1 DUF2238 domain-containing protein [archaeon]